MIALYERLSLADDDFGVEKEESNSIVNQRKTLRSYLVEHPDIIKAGEKVEEFIDDGYSGTNFDRPAFQRMLEGIKNDNIKTILVKDFSRFGRNYIDVGEYTENVFPKAGVRFIAVNDGYDSASLEIGDSSDMEFVMKNMMNSYYSRDLSVKIASTKGSLARKGAYLGPYPPMGYDRSPDDIHKLIVDEVARPYIRRIFDLAIARHKTSEIARIANRERIPTPNKYLVQKGVRTEAKNQKLENAVWSLGIVLHIIKNPIYKGTMVNHKYTLLYPCAGKVRKNKPEEMCLTEYTHEGIVSEEEFEIAQQILRKQKPAIKLHKKEYRLKGKVYCANCHRVMTYVEQIKAGEVFYCKHYKEAIKERPCVPDKISEPLLAEIVLGGAKQYMLLLDKAVSRMKELDERRLILRRKIVEEITRLEEEIAQIQKEKISLYEAYADGSVSREEFKKKSAEMIQEIDTRKKEIVDKKNEKTQHYDEENKNYKKLQKTASEAADLVIGSELTREMVEIFLDRIEIIDSSHIEIKWNYLDVIQDILKE